MAIPKIEIYQNSSLWHTKVFKKDIRQALHEAASCLALEGRFSLTILLATDDFIRPLNKDFRNHDKATDVLSFPQQSLTPTDHQKVEGLNLGDIVLAYETIQKDALLQNKEFPSHVMHLIIHGFLHLLGYDHQTKKEAMLMERQEIEILKRLKIRNPYEETSCL